MPSREQILVLNSEQTNLQRTGISDASDVATIEVAGDQNPPSSPVLNNAYSVPDGVKLEISTPTLNADGTSCVDLRWLKIFWGTTTGVYTGNAVIAARAGESAVYIDTNIGTLTEKFYAVTAIDSSGNESIESNEKSGTGGGADPNTYIPDDAGGHVFDDTIGTQGVVVGDGILGIAFKNPADSWLNFDHYRLGYQWSSDGGSTWNNDGNPLWGDWTEITPTNRIGYLHKGLTKTNEYRYKAIIVAADGIESTTPDKSKADDSGHFPNGGSNSLIVAELVFAENIVATNEVRGEHFFAESYLAINDATFGNDGIQLQYNGGTPRAYIGDGGTNYIQYTSGVGLSVSGNITITGGSGIASLSDAGSLATLSAVGAANCNSTIISGGKIITGLLTASNIQTGTLNASLITVTNLSATSITTGSINFSNVGRSNLSIANGEIAANAVRTNQIYIDGTLNFKPGSTFQSIQNIDKIYGDDSTHFISLWTNDSIGIYAGSGNVLSVNDGDGLYMSDTRWTNTLTFTDVVATDSKSFKIGHEGYIECKAGAVTRYIAFREES